MTEKLVCLDNIYLSFYGNRGDRLRVLDGVSFDVIDKEFLAILGPSGCGKSTLLRIMAGLLESDKGRIHWREGLFEERPSRMAMNFQKPVLLPWLTVEQNAVLPFRLFTNNGHVPQTEAVTSRLEELLRLTGLEGFRHSLPHELSGGMQMRAALIRTLITEPELIFMDEPFSAIDELTRQVIGKEFRTISKAFNASTIFVTHSIQEAAFLSDRIIVLSARPSRVVEDIKIRYSSLERTDSLRRQKEFLDVCDHLREVISHE